MEITVVCDQRPYAHDFAIFHINGNWAAICATRQGSYRHRNFPFDVSTVQLLNRHLGYRCPVHSRPRCVHARPVSALGKRRDAILQLSICMMASVKLPVQFLSLIHISEPTRLGMISYAVFCLKKKKQEENT